MKVIDGSRGEGGGQVARVALALAAATRTPTRVENLRAGRPEPGLKAGHVAAFRALAQLCDGEIDGCALGSSAVTLRPGLTVGGEAEFRVETAGALTLVLQALLPAAAASRQSFRWRLVGGTNVAWAPQWDDFVHVHAPLLAKLGIEVTPRLARRGFFPVGGGEVDVEVATPALRRLDLVEPGAMRAVRGVVASHGLPRHVVERATIAIREAFPSAQVELDFHRGPGTGFAVSLRAECDATVLGGDAVGRKGTRVEQVVAEAAARLKAELASGAAVDVHQADQLPIFMALAGGGALTTRMLTPHARTVLELLPEFLPVHVATSVEEKRTRVQIS